MPNIAAVLKEEITRLARKEVKAQVSALKKSSAQHRRDLAALKRENAALSKKVARLTKQLSNAKDSADSTEEETSEIRFSPAWVSKHREKLGLSAADYASLVGVSHLTIYNWEHGRTRPQRRQLEAWAEVRKLGKREAWARLEE